MIAAYDWAGGREAMLRFGPEAGPVVLAVLPPFEEANRTRALIVRALRLLAADGIAGALPDLPGQGESLLPTELARLADWRSALAAAATTLSGPVHCLSVRAGALLDRDAAVASRWRLSPQTGGALLRELVRTRQAAAREDGERFDGSELDGDGPPIDLAGNRIARRLLADLRTAVPSDAGRLRTVRLESDLQPADARLPAAPPWRRAEPDGDPPLAAAIAADVATWVRACAD